MWCSSAARSCARIFRSNHNARRPPRSSSSQSSSLGSWCQRSGCPLSREASGLNVARTKQGMPKTRAGNTALMRAPPQR